MKGCPEFVPVPACVPVPGRTKLSGISICFLCVIESGTGTGLRPGHGHEFFLDTTEPVIAVVRPIVAFPFRCKNRARVHARARARNKEA